jgi:hypothetical protein
MRFLDGKFELQWAEAVQLYLPYMYASIAVVVVSHGDTDTFQV